MFPKGKCSNTMIFQWAAKFCVIVLHHRENLIKFTSINYHICGLKWNFHPLHLNHPFLSKVPTCLFFFIPALCWVNIWFLAQFTGVQGHWNNTLGVLSRILFLETRYSITNKNRHNSTAFSDSNCISS